MEDHDLLLRVDEKLTALHKRFDDFLDSASNFVTRDEFEPVKKLVYGVVGLILVAFVGAVVTLVIR